VLFQAFTHGYRSSLLWASAFSKPAVRRRYRLVSASKVLSFDKPFQPSHTATALRSCGLRLFQSLQSDVAIDWFRLPKSCPSTSLFSPHTRLPLSNGVSLYPTLVTVCKYFGFLPSGSIFVLNPPTCTLNILTSSVLS